MVIPSLDDLKNVVTPRGLDGGYWAIRRAIEAIEKNKTFRATILREPHMSKRGMRPTLSFKKYLQKKDVLMMNFISLCDGETPLLDIAEYLDTPIWELYDVVDKLESYSLIEVNE